MRHTTISKSNRQIWHRSRDPTQRVPKLRIDVGCEIERDDYQCPISSCNRQILFTSLANIRRRIASTIMMEGWAVGRPDLTSCFYWLTMKITLTRSAVVMFTMVAGSILANSRSSVAQDDAAPADVKTTQNPPAQRPAPVFDESIETDEELGYQALMQGPVHEAFAAPIDSDHTDGVRVLDKAPPKAVDEQPPEDRPEDEAMKWIPGYWAWSDDGGDFVWVSGLWRKTPPGRNWVPGSWSETKSGHHRWTSGYWAGEGTSADNANYLPLPPKSIDNGPSVSSPSDDSFWVPGQWEYADGDYQWRSGFWSESQGDLVWQPACYVYTPQGYVLVDGYWDYLPPDRGQLYAPIEFYDPVYLQPNYVYRPRYPLADAASLLLSLFVRRGYPHYYYGDFYGSSYFGRGYRPWYDIGFGYGHVTPWLNHYHRKYRRSGIDFVGSMHRYENHARNNQQRAHTRHESGKRSISGGASQGPSKAPAASRRGRSLDDVVRSDIARAPINRNGGPSRSNPGRNFGGSSADFSRSSASSGRQQQFRNSSRGSTNPSGVGRSDSFRSNNSGQFSGSPGRRGTSSGLPTGIGSNQNSRSRSSRSIGTSPSSNFRSFGSSSRVQRGPSRSIQSGPSPSSSFRSRGATPSFQRGPSTSIRTGRSSSGYSGRSNIGRSNRGGGGGSRAMSSSGGSGRSSFSGGSRRSSFSGGSGRSGGGGRSGGRGRSGGSKGRGGGKK